MKYFLKNHLYQHSKHGRHNKQRKHNKGFSIIFFVIITSAMLILAMVNSLWWHAYVRERVLAHNIALEAQAAARSCAQRALFWSENSIDYASSYLSTSPYMIGKFSCKVLFYQRVSGVRVVTVEVAGSNYYAKESYSVTE